MLNPKTAEKLEDLQEFFGSFSKVLIAFSGGVDSATLAALANQKIEEILAVTIKTKVTPSREIEIAKKIALELGLKHEFLNLDVFKIDGFVKNSEERCYFCKKAMLRALVEFAESRGFEIVFEGTNLSDLKGDRPGFKAVLEEKKVISPWVKFGFEKGEIREVAKIMGFSFYNFPSLPCLATRIPYGVKITEEALERVDMAENMIISLFGVQIVRVRDIGGIAIIEIDEKELERFLEVKKIVELKKCLQEFGFRSVLLDLSGYSEGGAKKYSAFVVSEQQY